MITTEAVRTDGAPQSAIDAALRAEAAIGPDPVSTEAP